LSADWVGIRNPKSKIQIDWVKLTVQFCRQK
jgi:hypothetical protein